MARKQNPEEVESRPAEEAPQVEAPREKATKDGGSVACQSSPTGDHDIFHNEGTDEKYCRYCGKTE